MVSFGKNKEDKAVKKHRYDLTSIADEDIADILLAEKNEAPLAAALVEPEVKKGEEVIYELVIEEQSVSSAESSALSGDEVNKTAGLAEQVKETLNEQINLNEQVEKLCREYEVINQQLEKSLLASDELTKQLTQSKNSTTTNYLALAGAGFAFLLGVGAIVAGMSMQHDMATLQDSVASLSAQIAMTKKQDVLKNQEMQGQISQLNDKVNKIFAADNLDNVLQVTQELRKQVHALANKNLAAMNSRNESIKPDKIALPSLKLNTKEELPADKKLSTNPLADKAVSATAKVDAIKKVQEGKLVVVDNPDNTNESAHWAVTFGTFNDKTFAKNAADKFKQAGILVEIIPLKSKKHLRYRVVSKTFENKQGAQNLVEQVKKNLGIHSAMLTKAR